MDESFEAEKAKEIGEHLLEEKNLNNKPYRCTSSKEKIIFFHT